VPKGEHPNYPDGVEDDTHFSPRGAAIFARAFARLLQASSSDLRHLLK